MKDIYVTVTGWVAADAALVLSKDREPLDIAKFRVAQTPRHFSSGEGQWVNAKTEWFTVKVFGVGARAVVKSIKKGQPVIVTGKLRTNEWATSEGEPRIDLVIEATAVGHDATFGVSDFTRAVNERGDGADGTESSVAHRDGDAPVAGEDLEDARAIDDAGEGAFDPDRTDESALATA
ncbi:single-stranded DNA-binding protein [Demequina globuliformis]|uniref:single-stranded DNA-binding protein n=1 Tax=Demequina globuliformis TaxID=676202 RepID=UPI000783955D|nr:single-stranded DNA-binding protein [Demequina globuliformis]